MELLVRRLQLRTTPFFLPLSAGAARAVDDSAQLSTHSCHFSITQSPPTAVSCGRAEMKWPKKKKKDSPFQYLTAVI